MVGWLNFLGCLLNGQKQGLITLPKTRAQLPQAHLEPPRMFGGKLIHGIPRCYSCHAETQRAAHSASLFGSLVVRRSHLTQKRPMVFERLWQEAIYKPWIEQNWRIFCLQCWCATWVICKLTWPSQLRAARVKFEIHLPSVWLSKYRHAAGRGYAPQNPTQTHTHKKKNRAPANVEQS